MYERFKALKIERDGAILTLTIDHPPSNAISESIHAELAEIFPLINRDPDTRVVVLTGAGDRAFSAGGDIQHMVELLDDPRRAVAGFEEAQEILYDMLRLNKPMIARINGHAVGLGMTLALFCDLTYAVEDAKLGDPHVNVGFAAGDGGALIWPQMIGYARAREYLLTGDLLRGREAAEIGLITRAVPREELDDVVYGMAKRLAGGATVAINATKKAINSVLRRQLEGLIEVHSHLELVSHFSDDHAEAAHAFLEKRDAKFTGS